MDEMVVSETDCQNRSSRRSRRRRRRRPPLRRRQQRRKKSKKGAAVASLARSLARFVRSFVLSPPPLEKIAVAAFFYGSGRIVVGAFSELRIINFGMDALSPNNLMKYNTFIFCR